MSPGPTYPGAPAFPSAPPGYPQPSLPQIAVKHEPAYLNVKLDLLDGRKIHIGPDDPATGSIWAGALKQLTFETARQGGFGPADITASRSRALDQNPDALLLARCRVVDSAGRKVHESRVTGAPRTGVNEVEIQTEGYAKHLEDDHSAAEIFRDIDLSAFQPISNGRKVAMRAFTIVNIVDGSSTIDTTTGNPSLLYETTAPFAGITLIGMQYDAGAARLGGVSIIYTPRQNIGAADANWTLRRSFGSDDLMTVVDNNSTSPTGGAATFFDKATTPKRFYELVLQYAIANAGNMTITADFLSTTVYGEAGLILSGGTAAAGFKVSDMARYIVTKWAPKLQILPDSIEETSFLVPQAKWTQDDNTAASMLDALRVFGGNTGYPLDYGATDDLTFYMRTPGTYGRRLRFRRDEAMNPNDQGPDASERWNGMLMTYNPGDGSTKVVGPVGSRSDFETDGLLYTDPNNPWNMDGTKHWGRADAQITNTAGATLLGQLILAEKNRNLWRGSVTVEGDVKELGSQADHPPYMIRGGDRFVVEDDTDQRERLVENTKYDNNKRSNEVTVGAPPDRFDTMLARAGVVITGMGT